MTSPKNARSRSGRVYVWPPEPPFELEVPNVTGIISGGLPKPFLKGWAAREVATAAVTRPGAWRAIQENEGDAAAIDYLKGAPYRHTRKRADVGTEVHDVIERRIKGQHDPEDVSEEAKGFLRGYERFEREWRPTFEHAEVTIYSRLWEYAGTADGVATLGARPDLGRVIVDWKTSKALYADNAMQLTALAKGDFIAVERDGKWYEEPIVGTIDNGLLVRFTANGEYEVRIVPVTDAIFGTFLACKRVARWDREIAPTALSEPIILDGAAPQLTHVESPAVHEALAWLRDNGPATLGQVAEALDITERAAKGRLRKGWRDHRLVQYDDATELFSYAE